MQAMFAHFCVSATLATLLSATSGISWAQALGNVTELRAGKVTLFKSPHGEPTREVTRESFQPPWPVTGAAREGFLPIRVQGETLWVKTHLVKTDKPVESQGECNVVVASKQPKTAATRGLGKGC